MRWFFSGRKAARGFLSSQQYHLHGGSDLRCRSRFFHALNSMGLSKSIDQPFYRKQSSLLLSVHLYSISTILNAPESTYRWKNGNTHENYNKKVDLEIISRETIKPASPTPHHLRTFNLSIMDQFMYDCYTPLILFLPNNNKASITDVVTKRSKHLKETLSEILTQFYPVAGEVKDNLHIECNDKGVYFMEARVNQSLEDFLRHPDDQKLRELTPESFCTLDSSIANYVIGVQVNIFNCGAIGLCTSLAHRFVDGHSYFIFMKAWAAAARGSPESISPSFVASELFPNNPSLKYSVPSKLMTTKSLTTKRFLFHSTAMALLKAQLVSSSTSLRSCGPTRMEATTALIWKATAKAASTIRPFGPQSPHALLSMTNLRKRASPPLPDESIGNVIDAAAGICFPDSQPDLASLMSELRESIAKIDTDHVESRKGEKGHEKWNETLRKLNDLVDGVDEGDCLFATSLLNNGMYEMDFGWGKPIWFYHVNPGFSRIVSLNDTTKGGGVEAIVTLSPNEMELFERDPELLSYATVNPSPLQFLNE